MSGLDELHEFDPGGRAHWDMPRCTVCREFKEHPLHRAPGPDGALEAIGAVVGFACLYEMDPRHGWRCDPGLGPNDGACWLCGIRSVLVSRLEERVHHRLASTP